MRLRGSMSTLSRAPFAKIFQAPAPGRSPDRNLTGSRQGKVEEEGSHLSPLVAHAAKGACGTRLWSPLP
jgi:hypothetical protein